MRARIGEVVPALVGVFAGADWLGYLLMEIEQDVGAAICADMRALEATIRVDNPY